MNESLHSRIADHPFFQDMKDEHLDVIVGCASETSFRPGQVIFREGDPANQFYLIETGLVAIEAHEARDGTVPVQNLGPGEVLGWSWLFAPFSWHFRARAVEPTRVIVMNGAHLLTTAERDTGFGYELMKRVAQVVIHRLQSTRNRLTAEQFESALKG